MDAVEEIKNRLAIEEVIGEYVELKRAGRNWRGLSPFTSERSPSFIVSPEKQIWHDFSSGKGGNLFSFVMEMEGLDFKGALELLARKAGVDLEQYRPNGRSSGNAALKERLYGALELSAKFYQAQFKNNKVALQYVLGERGFTKETALEWQIGYSPNGGSALTRFLKLRKFTDDEIRRAGLSARRYQGENDMFRGRIMIPLADAQGRIIGFTARILEDDPKSPKYINTPQTLLYDKSRHVFGLHLAKEAIRKSSYAVVTEGNLDVITSHQAGIRQVVATAGTALTEHHLKTLGRFTEDIRLSFDADKAGLAATERAIPIASKTGVSLSIVSLPGAKDPDELIRQNPKAWLESIEQSEYALDWLIERYLKLQDISSALGKRQFSDVILKVVNGLTDPVEQEHYLRKVSELIGVSLEALQAKLLSGKTVVRHKSTDRGQQVFDKSALVEATKVQDHFLSLMFRQPKLRDFLQRLEPDMFNSGQAADLFKFLKDNPEFAGTDSAKGLQSLADYAKILALQYEELYGDLDIIELRYEAARLQARLIEQYVKTKKQILTGQLNTTDEASTAKILEQVKQLDLLLKQAKEA
jgi:DNA primase